MQLFYLKKKRFKKNKQYKQIQIASRLYKQKPCDYIRTNRIYIESTSIYKITIKQQQHDSIEDKKRKTECKNKSAV